MRLVIEGTADEIGHFVPNVVHELNQLGGTCGHAGPESLGGGMFQVVVTTDAGAPYREDLAHRRLTGESLDAPLRTLRDMLGGGR